MAQQTKNSTGTPFRKPFRSRTRFLVAAVTGCFTVGAIAQSSGFTVDNGTAVPSKVGAVTTITNSNGAILNWNQFNIAAGDTTHFLQPSVSSAVLNRVLGSDPSQIYGTLSSNGRVWLINPAGIMVGASGRVDTAGFVASTLGVSNSDFLAGRLNFGMDGGNAAGVGAVVNQGAITTSAGGSVYLVASNVTNEGIITTPQGETILAAGQTVQLIDTATPGVKVEITGAEGNATNLGTIVSDAGRIGIAGVIAKNSGTLNASSVVSEGGRVFLKASQDAYVDGAGRIVTTGTKGGSVEVLGSRVAVMDNASIVASGTNGGGTIKIGGDYQGKNPDVQNAVVAYFGPNASMNVDATSVGAGGTLIVWADDTTRALGSISARGGADGGDGGFVETSGKRYLAVDGVRVDTRARGAGKTGTWLLDPSDISIVSGGSTNAATTNVNSVPYGGPSTTEFTTGYGGVSTISDATINSQLLTTDVVIHTAGGTGGNGNIVINGANIFGDASAHALTLAADASINPTGGNITITSSVLDVDDGVTLLAGWNGVTPPYGPDGNTFSSTDVINGRGNINLSGATLKSAAHGVYLWAGKDVNLVANSLIQASMTEIIAGNDVIANGGRIGGVTSAQVAIDIDAGRDISITGSAFETFGGAMNFTSGQDFKLTANVNGGSIVSTAGCSTPADVGCRENPSTFTFAPGGMQTITAVGKVIVEAHPGGGAGVALFSGGGQTITADSVEVRGGLVGNGNDAWITNRSTSGQTISAHSITLQGGGSGPSDQNNDAGIFSTGLQTIYVTGAGGALTLNGGSATGTASKNAAFLGTGSGASQMINVAGGGTISLQGGGGSGSFENWAAISSSSNQTINIHDGGTIVLRGGAGNGNNNSVTPADGTSNNYARIIAPGAQSIGYYGATPGRLDLYGGSVGNSNYARISQTGSAHQSISGNPIITLTGGDSGGLGFSPAITDDLLSGAFAPPRGNTAIIASGKAFDTDTDENSAGFGQVDPGTWVQGTQSIDAAEITINGSSRTVTATGMGGAGLFSAYGQTVNVQGDLKLLGGNATNTILPSARSRTRLWSMGGEQVINANQLHIIGAATGTNNIATIGSWGNQTINLSAAGTEGPALWLQTNGSGATNLLNNSLSGNQTITFSGIDAALKVEGAFSGLGTNSNNLNTAHPNQSINFNSGGSIEVIGVGRALTALDFFAIPRAEISSSGNQEILGATSITLIAADTANGRAIISAEGDQHIQANELSLFGGNGTSSNSYASIEHGYDRETGGVSVWGSQRIDLTGVGATVVLQGGFGSGIDSRTDQYGALINPNSTGNYAQIRSRLGQQTINFAQSGGSLSLIGGRNGNNNFAEIKASYGQTISGAPNVFVSGGTTGGVARVADNVMTQGGHERSNHAYISGGDDENVGPTSSVMTFNSLTIQGGGNASSYAGAGIEGFNLTLNVAQNATIMGGGSNTLDAGDEVPNATSAAHIGADGQLTLNVGGHLTIAAGTGSSGLAFVGSGGPAAINLTVGGDLELSAKENAASSAGVGSLFGQATGSILVGGSADLLAQYGGKVVIGSHLGPMLGIPYPADLTPPSVLPPLLNGGDVAVTNGLTIGASDSGATLTVGASRNIKLIGANITGNSSYGLAVNLYAGSSVNDELLIANSVVETFGQDMHLSASNITLTADASRGSAVSTAGCAVAGQSGGCSSTNQATFVHGGVQTVQATELLKLQANDAGGNGVALISGGGQEVFAHRIELTAGLTGEKNGAFLTNYADQPYNGQVVSANQIVMKAGGSGANDFGNRAVIASFGASQEINVNGANGVLSLQGGAGFGIDTSFQIGKLVTTPADPVNSVPEVATPLYGSNNTAQIYSEGGSQAIHFGATGGSITMTGGTRGPIGTATGEYGTANNALIWNDAASAQVITGRPTITLVGGASGGDAGSAFNSYTKFLFLGVSMERNVAMIASGRGEQVCTPSPCTLVNHVAGTQNISAQQITLKGTGLLGAPTSTGRSSAVVNAGGGQTIDVLGELSLQGGDKTDVRGLSTAQVRNFSGVQAITAERLSLTGTTTTSSRPNDASVTSNGAHQTITLTKSNGNALSMNTNAATSVGVSAGTSSGSPLEVHQTITFTGANAGATMDGAAAIGLFASNQNGLQSIVFQNGGSLSMTGGAMRANVSPVLWSFSNQSILGATSISLVGGNQAFSGGQQNLGGASILSFGDQRLETNSLSLIGGSGPTAYANSVQIGHSGLPESATQPSWGNQTIVMTGANATLTLAGGSGAGSNPNASGNSGNYARIQSGQGLQTIQFSQSGGGVSISGGSVGTDNSATISSDFGQTITGNPAVVIQGGSSGGAATVGIVNGTRERGNDAGIFGGDEEDGGTQVSTLDFASLTIQGGTAEFGTAGVGGDIVNLHVQGNVSLNGGSSNQRDPLSDLADGSTVAFIGHDEGGALNLDIGGNLTMTSGSGSSGPVIIGSIEGASANVHVVGNVTVTAGVARAVIGSAASATEYGGDTSVSVVSGGDVTVTAGTVATGSVVIGSTNNKIIFDGCRDGCEDLGTGSVNVELIAGRNITVSGQTGGVTIGTQSLGVVAGPADYPPPDPSSHVTIAAGAAYPSVFTFGGGGGVEASGYGGNISTVGPVSIKTDQFSNASIQVDAFESSGGAAGNISLAQGTLVDGDRISLTAGGDVNVGGSITGTDKVDLAAGWVHNLEIASTRGGNLTLASTGSVSSSVSEAEVWAAEGVGQPNGNVTLDGTMNGNYGVGIFAGRDVRVNGTVTASREGWDAIQIMGGDSDDASIIGNVFFGPNSVVTASNGGGLQVRAEGPSGMASGDIVQDAGSTITADDDIKMVATGNLVINGDLTSNNDEIILFAESQGTGTADGNITIGLGSELRSQRLSIRAAGDVNIGGLIVGEDGYVHVWAGDTGEGESARGGNVWLQSSGVIQAYEEVEIAALSGAQTGTGGNVELSGSITSTSYDYGAVNVWADRNITVSGSIDNGAGDYYRGIYLAAGVNNSGQIGGDINIQAGSNLEGDLSSVRLAAYGGTETAGNINQTGGVVWGNYAKYDADGDITIDGSVGGRYYTEFNAGLNRTADRGGDVVFGPSSVVNPAMTIVSPNGGVRIVAQVGKDNLGSISFNGGRIDGGGEGITITADSHVMFNGVLNSTDEVSVTAGHKHNDLNNNLVGTGGDITFGAASQLDAKYFSFNALGGSAAQGHIVQNGGRIESLFNTTLRGDGDVTVNGHVEASYIELDGIGNVMQTSGGLLAGGHGVSVYAGGHVDLLGNVTVADGGEGYVYVSAGHVRSYYDDNSVYHPGGVQLVRDKHIMINSLSGAAGAPANLLELSATGPITATVQDFAGVTASIANGTVGGITINLSGATEPVLHLADGADSQKSVTVNRGSGDLLVTDASVFNANGGQLAFAAQSGNLNWGAVHAYGGSLSLAAGGAITQSTPINFASLTTNSGSATTLTTANDVANYSGIATGVLEFDAAGSLVVGNVTGSQLVALSSGGALSQTGIITAGSLFTESTSGTTLTGNNSVSSYSGYNSGTGNIAFTNVKAGDLMLADLMQQQFAVQNDVEGGAVTIATAGSLSQSSTVNAASLMTTTAGGTQLGLANQVFTYSGQNAGTGAIELRSGDVNGLVVGAVSNTATAGHVRLASAATMTVSGHIASTASIVLTSAGAIVAPGNLTGLTLNSTSVGGADFSGENQLGSIAALNNSGSGAIELNNTASTLNIAQINNTVGGVGIDNDGAITVSGPVTASGLVGLAALGVGGDISQTGGAISSGGDVILLADRSVSLNGQTTAVGNVSVLAGLNVVGTAGGNIAMGAASQVSAHDIVLIADRDTGSGSFTTGNVTQQAGSNLQSSNDFLVNASGNINLLGTVAGGAAGRTHLLAGFNNSTGAEQGFTGAQVTASNLQANGGSVSIQATGAVNAVVQAADSVVANINNSASGGLNLTSYGANALVLIDNSTANSGVTLNYQNGPLTLGANSALVTANGAGKVSVAANGGNLVYSGANVSATEVRLNSTGTISQTAALTTDTLYTVSAGGTAMTMDNVVGTYSGLNSSSGNLAFKSVKTGGLVLAGTTSTAVQNSAATGDISITSAGAGALTINGMVTGLRNVAFTSAGAVNATTKLSGAGLNSVSIGGANFSGPNQFATVADLTNTGSGNVVFKNTASPLTINKVSNSVGNVTVDNTGAVIINGPMTASGTLSVTALSPVTVTSSGSVRSGGNLSLTASSSSVASTLDLLTIAGEVASNSGDIALFGGSGIVVTNNVVATNGDVVAESPFGPITQNPKDLIRAPNGEVTLLEFGLRPKDPIVIPPETIPDTNTNQQIGEIVVVVALNTGAATGPTTNIGDSTTGGTSGTFGATEEKKEEEKKGTAGAEASAEEKPAAQKAVGSCT